MSRHFYAYCRSCKDQHDLGLNHGERNIRCFLRHAKALAALYAVVRDLDADLSVRVWDWDLDTSWFALHADHELAVIDEYGRIDEQCLEYVNCSACDQRHHCRLQQGHSGPCLPPLIIRSQTP